MSKIELTTMELISRVIGPIKPVGETHTDGDRFENLKEMIELVDAMIVDIIDVSGYSDRPEYSMSRAGNRAEEYLTELLREIAGVLS